MKSFFVLFILECFYSLRVTSFKNLFSIYSSTLWSSSIYRSFHLSPLKSSQNIHSLLSCNYTLLVFSVRKKKNFRYFFTSFDFVSFKLIQLCNSHSLQHSHLRHTQPLLLIFSLSYATLTSPIISTQKLKCSFYFLLSLNPLSFNAFLQYSTFLWRFTRAAEAMTSARVIHQSSSSFMSSDLTCIIRSEDVGLQKPLD